MDIGLFALHVIPGALFMGHGAQKLFGVFGGHGIDGTGGFFESLGLKPGRLHARAAGSAEFFGGLLLALGLLVPLAAAVLIATMLTASLTAHRGKGVWAQDGGFELPLVYATIAFGLGAVGVHERQLEAAVVCPAPLAAMSGEGGGEHRGDQDRRGERHEQPEREQQPAEELRGARRPRVQASRPQAERLEEAARPVDAMTTEYPEE